MVMLFLFLVLVIIIGTVVCITVSFTERKPSENKTCSKNATMIDQDSNKIKTDGNNYQQEKYLKNKIKYGGFSIINDGLALIDKDEVYKVVENFIKMTPPKYFLDCKYIGEFEYCLEPVGLKDRVVLLTDRYPDLRKENNEINLFMKNEFKMFSKIISKNFHIMNVTKEELLNYQLLKNGACKYFSKLWEDRFGFYFEEIKDKQGKLNLQELVKKYCEIDDLDHKDCINVGQFTYFIKFHYERKETKYYNTNDYKYGYISLFNRLMDLIRTEMKHVKLAKYEKKLMSDSKDTYYTIDDIDLMGGLEFERFIAELFIKMGYAVEVTKASGDQGIDVIAEKNGRKIGIQAKCYSSKVTNSAIQEAVAGIQHYRLDKGMVVTNNWFTVSAQELAESNNIILWDRNRLKEKLSEVTF